MSDPLLTEIQAEDARTDSHGTVILGSRAGGQASLQILQSIAEFEEHRDTWSAWSDGPEADLDFFKIHLRHRYEAVRPHVMVVYRNGRPDCMLVGWVDRGPVAFKVGSLAICRSQARILRFVNGGFLGNQSRENSQFLIQEIIRSLKKKQVHAVEFSQLREDSQLYDLAKREPNVFCRDHFTPVQTHRYLTLPASFDILFSGLSSKCRKEFNRHARTIERDFSGEVRFESVRDGRDVEDFAWKADEISRKSYKYALGAGFVNNSETREMLRLAAQKGVLRACVLHIGQRPIAFAAGILSNGTLYATFTGYDPGFKKYSPGLQSIMRLIEASFEPNGWIVRFDAGCGDSSYKRMLFASSWKEAPVWIFAPSARGLSLHVFKLVSTLLHSLAMSLLAKSNYLRKVKNAWHRRGLREFQRL
jgi:hypothetical protein